MIRWVERVTRQAVGLMVVGLVASCGTGTEPPVSVADNPSRVMPDVLGIGYSRIADVYVDPVDMSLLAVDGLDGLSSLDAGLSARRHGDFVQLLAGGTVVASYPAPSDGDSRAWAHLTLDAVHDGRTFSSGLQQATADEIYEALFAAIATHLDPYSRYVNPDDAEQERAYRDGYGGIGLLLDDDEDGAIRIEEVFADGPASRAGIQAEEIIVAVNGESVIGWSLQEVGRVLRGPIDTMVQIGIRDAALQVRTLDLRREKVVPNVVSARYEDDVAILRITRFNAETADDVGEAIDQAMQHYGTGLDGIILDLRGNPGGLLDQSVAVADLFIPRGEIIRTLGRHHDSQQRFVSQTGDRSRGVPLVTLIDGRSASGAEVVAAALQDSSRSVLIGASSYGKGSVQTVTRLPNSGELFLTWSRIYAPSGYTLNELGVLPDICTSVEPAEEGQLSALLRQGALTVPRAASSSRYLAADDPAAMARLRDACPWHEHDEELDIQVALELLHDPNLFQQALWTASQPSMASR